MASLFTYQKMTQRMIRDQRQAQINPEDLKEYINTSRREVAMRSQCVRILTPISGSIIGWSVTNGGSNYSNSPTFTVSAPDFPSGYPPFPNGEQATATGIVQGGSITAIFSQFGGYGYWQPKITITDSTGSGANATPTMSYINQLNANQELYPFSAINLSAFPGVGSPYMVRTMSILYSNYRYTVAVPSFSAYQSLIRNYPLQFSYIPFYAAQFGRGTGGSLFFYPIPNSQYQLELDLCCLPQDLIDDQSVEVLPDPFTDAVPFLAAYYAMNEMQLFNQAKYYKTEFDEWMRRYGSAVNPGRVINWYGRSIT